MFFAKKKPQNLSKRNQGLSTNHPMQTYNYKVTLLISIGEKSGYFTHNQYFIINTLKNNSI